MLPFKRVKMPLKAQGVSFSCSKGFEIWKKKKKQPDPLLLLQRRFNIHNLTRPAENSCVIGIALSVTLMPLIPSWQEPHWGCWSGAGAGSSGHPHQQSSSSLLPNSHGITRAPTSFLKLEKGARKGGREEVTEIVSEGTQPYSY